MFRGGHEIARQSGAVSQAMPSGEHVPVFPALFDGQLRPMPGEEPVLLTPGAAGGHNWNPMSYSPLTGLVRGLAVELAALEANEI